jgi:hypothetical protein
VGFWIREIVGWLLILLGIYGYWIALAFLATQPSRLIEGATTAFMSTMLFRGGLLLVRISAAARAILQSKGKSLTSTTPKSDR